MAQEFRDDDELDARYRVGDRVGVGGPGEVAPNIAHAPGAEVTAPGRSTTKEDDALRLGADHFRATRGGTVVTELADSFDHRTSSPPPAPGWSAVMSVTVSSST